MLFIRNMQTFVRWRRFDSLSENWLFAKLSNDYIMHYTDESDMHSLYNSACVKHILWKHTVNNDLVHQPFAFEHCQH